MFLQAKSRNRFTIGKTLRKLKGLRKTDLNGEIVDMPEKLREYVESLQKKGLVVKGLKFALFKTKNGLPYSGLMADCPLNSSTILVRVPVECLLTTRDAFYSEVRQIFLEHPLFFSKRFTPDWEDRMLLVYILYEYQKGKDSRWYSLIVNLPREIDYVIFWSETEIKQLEDPFMEIGIRAQRDRFNQQCNQMMEITGRYPDLFKPGTMTQENIMWIHIHLVSRCFGSYFLYTTMVPFAELFNHDCTDVYYKMYYKPENPHSKNEQIYPEEQLTEQDMEEADTSDGSYDDDDFHEEHEQLELELGELKQSAPLNLNEQNTKTMNAIRNYLTNFISFNDKVSLFYLAEIYNHLHKLSVSEAPQSDIQHQLTLLHSTNVKYLQLVKQFFARLGKTTYSYGLKQKRQPKQQAVADKIEEGEAYFKADWKEEEFDDFLMVCSKKDQFQKGSQVFFCYGRLPNKLLLMRYGFALEHNKYNHVFIRSDITPFLKSRQHLLQVVQQEIQLNKYQRFKIKKTEMNVEVIMHLRIQKWRYGADLQNVFYARKLELELEVLQEARELYLEQLARFSSSLEQNEAKLTDPSLNYHQHFALIFRLEQQRIFTEQIHLIQYASQVINRKLKGGETLKAILLSEQEPHLLTRQIMMEKYFMGFKLDG